MQVEKLKTIDADTLLTTPLHKTLFVVEGLIPQGLSVLSGSSKIGKSWLVLWLGIQVARGNHVWEFKTHKCDVLYLPGRYLHPPSKQAVSIDRQSAIRIENCYNELSDRMWSGTADRAVSRRLSDDKACDYRHLSKGTGIQKHKREKRNVCG